MKEFVNCVYDTTTVLTEFTDSEGSDGYISVTDWPNNEGIDVTVNDDEYRKDHMFQLTWQQYEALLEAVKKLKRNV